MGWEDGRKENGLKGPLLFFSFSLSSSLRSWPSHLLPVSLVRPLPPSSPLSSSSFPHSLTFYDCPACLGPAMEPLPARHEPDPSSSRSSPQPTPTGPRMALSPPHSLKSTHTPTHDSLHNSVHPSPEFSSQQPAFENRGSLDTLAAAALKPLSDPFRQSQSQSQGQGQSDHKQRHSPPLPRPQRSISPAQAQHPSHSRPTLPNSSSHHQNPSSAQPRPLDFATVDSKSTQSRSRSTSPPAKSRLDSDQRSTQKALPSFQELSNGRGGDSSSGRHHYRDRSYQPSDDDSEGNPSANSRPGDHSMQIHGAGELAPSVVSQHSSNQDKAYKVQTCVCGQKEAVCPCSFADLCLRYLSLLPLLDIGTVQREIYDVHLVAARYV